MWWGGRWGDSNAPWRAAAGGWVGPGGRGGDGVAPALAVLNRAVAGHRVAAADPLLPDADPSRALAIRVGYGRGEQVAEGEGGAAPARARDRGGVRPGRAGRRGRVGGRPRAPAGRDRAPPRARAAAAARGAAR